MKFKVVALVCSARSPKLLATRAVDEMASEAFVEVIQDFGQRPQRVAEEAGDFRGLEALKTFRDVVTDGAGGGPESFAESEVLRNRGDLTNSIHLLPQFMRKLPTLEFSIVPNRHAKG